MLWTTKLRLRLRSLFLRGRVEDELAEELRAHEIHLVEDYLAAGLSPADARAAARRDMGNSEARKDECRDARGLGLIDSVRQDVIYAWRVLRKAPAFTGVAVLSLAFGIGANTAIFTLWNGVIRAPLPGVREPQQLVMLSDPDVSGSWTGRVDGARSWLTYGEFEDLRDHATALSGVMASQSSFERWQVRVDQGDWEPLTGRLVSGGFFEALGVRPAVGRLFTAMADREAAPEAVISHSYWQRRFDGRPDVLGKTLVFPKAVLTVVGVAPAGFIGETSGQEPNAWIPLRLQPQVLPGRDRLHDTPPEKSMWLHVFGRLRPGVTPAQAEAQANAIFQSGLVAFYGARDLEERGAQLLDQRLVLRPAARGASPMRRAFADPLAALLASVAVLLLIACINLASLLLARGAARRPELALRVSLGASRARVVRQLLTESVVLAALGAAAAIVVAYVAHGALVSRLAEASRSFSIRFTLDPLVLTFLVTISVGAALIFGLVPAWHATRTSAAESLQAQGRGAVDHAGTGRWRSGRLLVGLQFALCVPLLVAAGLFVRSLYNLQRADLGYPAHHLALVRVDTSDLLKEAASRDVLARDLLARIRQVPGVRAVTFSQLGLFSGGNSGATIELEGHAPAAGERPLESSLDVVGPGYFTTLGIPLLRGRDLLESDTSSTSSLCVVNEAFTRRFLDRRDPLGLRIVMRDDDRQSRPCRIVGVARDARTQGLREQIEPRYFILASLGGPHPSTPTFLIRTAIDTAPVLAAVRQVIRQAHGSLPIVSAERLEERMAPMTAQDRATALLAVIFGILAMMLVAIGLYGVLSYGITSRTTEMAVRMALGAQARGVIWMILRESLAVVLAGLAVGALLASAIANLVASRLYGVTPWDWSTLAVVMVVLLAVSLASAYLPARRGARVDPMTALRR